MPQVDHSNGADIALDYMGIPLRAWTGVVSPATQGPSPGKMQARIRMDALDDALGQIQELRERLSRLEGDRSRD